MPSRRWSQVYRLTREVAAERPRGGRRFSDRVIVLVLLWAAFHHKPISWAVQAWAWPAWMRRLLPRPPSSTTMSRRLRSASVRAFLDRLLELSQGPARLSLLRIMDGTALEVRNHSKDRQAGYGWGTGRMAKGYKLHVLLDAAGLIAAWRVTPMNTSEKRIAERLLRDQTELMYVAADGFYDSSRLHDLVRAKGGQLVAPRERNRRGREPTPRRYQAPGRLRSIELLEGPDPRFGAAIMHQRAIVERFFGHADSHAEALGELPAWVRTHRRVRTWVHAKLILNALRARSLTTAA